MIPTIVQCDLEKDNALCKLATQGYPTHVTQKCNGDSCETTFVRPGFMAIDQLKGLPELRSVFS
jgi:hypothetical protein